MKPDKYLRIFPNFARIASDRFPIVLKLHKAFAIYFLLFSISYAQLPTEEWVRRYNYNNRITLSKSIKLDTLGNVYVLGGGSTSDSTRGDFLVLKYDPMGNLLWNSFYNSPGNLSDLSNAFEVSNAGDIYVTGSSGIYGIQHITTVKYNTLGVLQWAKVYDGGGGEDDALGMCLDGNGNLIIVGLSGLGGNIASLTIKYNSSGDSLWVRKFTQLTNSNNNRYIVTDDSNNVYVAGDTRYACLLLKYNSNGDLLWYATDSQADLSWGLSIDSSRNCYIAGTKEVNGSLANNFLIKFNTNGELQWDRLFTGIRGINGGCEYPAGVVTSRDGNSTYYSTFCDNGSSYEIVTLKYNAVGDSQWVRRYGGGISYTSGSQPSALKFDTDGNLYISGSSYFSSTDEDIIAIKYLPNGSLNWSVSYNGPLSNGYDYGQDLFIDKNFEVYVTGVSRNPSNANWEIATIKYSQPIGINQNQSELPVRFELYQNYPNPFNPATEIKFGLPKSAHVTIRVFDILGKQIAVLANNEFKHAGEYSVRFDGSNFASGIYIYKIESEDFTDSKKMVLIK